VLIGVSHTARRCATNQPARFPNSGGHLAQKQTANLIVLAVFPAEEDRKSMKRVLAYSNWKLTFARDFRESQAKLRRSVPGVVISDHDLSNGYCWKDLLQELRLLEDPPPLIVVTRLADDFLWAEVLNLGAHDLLAKPFDKREVLHAVSTASKLRDYQRTFRPQQRSPVLVKAGGKTEMSFEANSQKVPAATGTI
jgi:DNA-binding response OmpR family regulator